MVLVGSCGYGGELEQRAKRLAEHPSVTWMGHVHDHQLLLALWQHAGLYFHGHSVGGTNPALVQAMTVGAPILARDTDYTREVLGSAGEFVSDDAEMIAKSVLRLMDNRLEREESSRAAALRAEQHYSWASVSRGYDSAMRAVMETRGVSAHAEVHHINGWLGSNAQVGAQTGAERLAM